MVLVPKFFQREQSHQNAGAFRNQEMFLNARQDTNDNLYGKNPKEPCGRKWKSKQKYRMVGCMNCLAAGSVAIVTGGSRGIGLALVQMLKRLDVKVEAPSQENLDIRDTQSVQTFVTDIVHRHGHIDVLINNAGWSPPLALIEDVEESSYDRCFDTNVKGTFNCLHAVLPIMKKQKSGIIINICSRAGTRAHPQLGIYSASKFAVRGLTQAVAKECDDAKLPIRCISISPGGVDTEMRTELFGKDDSSRQQKPEEIAAIVQSFLEGKSEFQQGNDVHIVGGQIKQVEPMH
jgi:NAD(P)-dependent dehydrogenase (short-subunit alcohol dehydrogenase family)